MKQNHGSTYHPWLIPESEIPSIRLTEDELLVLLNNIRKGKNVEESTQKIIFHHMRWALSISGKYIRKYGCQWLANDLDSEALLGLSFGASRLGRMKHDNVTGYLATYVRLRLNECIHKSPTVRVPRNRKPVFTTSLDTTSNYRKSDGYPYKWDKTSSKIYRNHFNTKEFIDGLRLSETERQFAMWRIEGYSFQEIADFLGTSLSQVYLIRKRMRKLYDERKRNC